MSKTSHVKTFYGQFTKLSPLTHKLTVRPIVQRGTASREDDTWPNTGEASEEFKKYYEAFDQTQWVLSVLSTNILIHGEQAKDWKRIC